LRDLYSCSPPDGAPDEFIQVQIWAPIHTLPSLQADQPRASSICRFDDFINRYKHWVAPSFIDVSTATHYKTSVSKLVD
jgi:hypothetical protein